MIPERLEYLFLAFLYAIIVAITLREPVLKLLKKRSFWLSCVTFCITWALIEIYALRHHLWVFSPNKICGLFIATVPIEEYIVFVLIHLSTVATWTVLKDLHDVA
jgi:lycopene cyclase domain-containing protein